MNFIGHGLGNSNIPHKSKPEGLGLLKTLGWTFIVVATMWLGYRVATNAIFGAPTEEVISGDSDKEAQSPEEETGVQEEGR